MQTKTHKTNFLVIGSGIAGLSFALKVADAQPNALVTIVTKDKAEESNTLYAQGGMAVVTDTDNDSQALHVSDTLQAGDGLCDKRIVELVVREAPERLHELIKFGAYFETLTDGRFALGREGGHTANRIVHRGDYTGREIHQILFAQTRRRPNIRILDHHMAVDLICANETCYGCYVLDRNQSIVFPIYARVTMLAAGGLGQVFRHTTNPMVATGDGVAMAFRAGAKIRDMEFVQFHPTAFFGESGGRSFLISEAVRGFGAHLLNLAGERFMVKYDPRLELATRDIVSRAIHAEMQALGHDHVLLDCRHLDYARFCKEFPTISDFCEEQDIDVRKTCIPVVPAAHYSCGGVATDQLGRTTIQNLYACGETANTGLHGANRLASNSLTEALVLAYRAGSDALRSYLLSSQGISYPSVSFRCSDNGYQLVRTARQTIQDTMAAVSIVSSQQALAKALRVIEGIRPWAGKNRSQAVSFEVLELENIKQCAELILLASLNRRENKGTFFKVESSAALSSQTDICRTSI